MDVKEVMEKIENLYSEAPDKVSYAFLEAIEAAELDGDTRALFVLCNEAIGHFRESGEHESSLLCAKKALISADELGLTDTIEYATTLINVGTAARAAGLLDAAKVYYNEALKIYDGKIAEDDFLYASLYNNLSLVYQKAEEYEDSIEYLKKALEIIEKDETRYVEIATTYSNLAVSEINIGRLDDAFLHLEKSFELFERDEKPDYHYSAALSAYAQALYLKGNLDKAAEYYEKALKFIEKVMGKSENYSIVLANLDIVNQQRNMLVNSDRGYINGLTLCEEYYREYGASMIREKFPEYEGQIAVGLVGEGSECFGFDDEFSRDHDFGPGFCMWLTDSLYNEIGADLEAEYENLPRTYKGLTRISTAKAGKRVGVFKISEFYENYIGVADVPQDMNTWLFLDDYRLRTVTNGAVFRDDLGEFSRIRNGILNYYPEEVRRKKLAREAALISQSGQYNYERMLKRNDTVTASIALSEFMSHTMQMIYLLNSTYAPFYKWMYRGLKDEPILNDIRPLISQLSMLRPGDDEVISIIEKIVGRIIGEMKKQGLTSSKDTYLDAHTGYIIASIEDKSTELVTDDNDIREDKEMDSVIDKLVDEIVKLEWETFDKVQNEGGRASCQDDFFTFSIMRKSQYMTWNQELLESYLEDIKAANDVGWNLITEKYGRMMASTVPWKWDEIKDNFPKISEEKHAIIEAIVEIQVGWMEEFANKYPRAATNARSIHTSEDMEYNTSYETYLRGEVSTYSDETLKLYGAFIADLAKRGENLAFLTMLNTAKLYGYESLDAMEKSLS